MRTTLDIPDSLLRQLKSKAALEGTTLKALVLELVDHGLKARDVLAASTPPRRSRLPSLSAGHALAIEPLSNAALFELLDDGDGHEA